ncbi:MAG TPA: cyclopropane-fatty-acyl-phospholipid synthase family protein [Mycobacterium sp.]|nr:cyclopropane-fatty-acyl-phospholipid synthase family protein [Mycobacterium sp.]
MAPVADRLADLVRATVGVDLPVRIRAWDGSEAGPTDDPAGPLLVVRSRRALRRLLWCPGELGLARAYVTGDIDVEGDLTDGLRRAWRVSGSRRDDTVSQRGWAVAALRAVGLGAVGLPPSPPASEARLSGRLHTLRRDRAAIAHHYDLSNDFYQLLLDDHMAYSSAYFTRQGQSLHDAQTAKLDMICRKLDLKAGAQLLDVGCGWGSLILYAAQRYGVRATGITLSARQRDFIVARAAERGLTDSVEVHLQDYRDFGKLPTSRAAFDGVASIEMGEHVGERLYPTYVEILHRALRPGGRLLLQQMSRRADAAPGGGAFIEAYIAPDMHMRPLWQTLRYLQDAGFEIRSVAAMREHYARTAEHWMNTLESRYDEFVALLGDEIARVWRLYLAGGRLAFEEGRMGVDQIAAEKAGAR